MSGPAVPAGHRRVVVTGVGVVSPLGDSPAALHAALCRGERALGLPDDPTLAELGRPRAGTLVGRIAGFDPAAYVGQGNFRPLDRTGRLAVAAVELALAAAGWGGEERREADLGLVLGTMFGSVRTIAEFDRRALTAGPNYVKPFDFANSVINAAAGQAAIWHGLRGVNATLAGGTGAGVQALGYAADLVAAGQVDAVAAGGADELCLESFLGFGRSGLLCSTNGHGPARPIPFDARRNGFAPAEGAALLVFEPADSAERRGAPALAEVLGHGAAFDPARGRDAASAAAAVARAVRSALAAAGVDPDDVACASVSASGSMALDRSEAEGLARALGPRAAELPVTAVKAGVGEALGASGALQAAVLLEALRTGELPGVAGLEAVEPGLPLGGIRPGSARFTGRIGLVTALDRHGGAHALVLAALPAVPGARPPAAGAP
ncbi:MAG TPA: beta-ketoacyl synthase N-terminal-like domain-containing protein [Thermoanaerobaculia bacterium]|nr:beta-ketoacyl synthase N-terminal-like domain-containing protein [Thermoanaerobaculia bacterium]